MRFPLRQLTPLAGALASFLALSCGGDNLVLPSEGTAASITIVGGNNQQGTVGAPLADSLEVRVLDQAGRPVPGQPVSWTVVAGGGSIAASSTTNADGRAAASWTLGSGAGTQQVRAKPTGNGAPENLQAAFSATAGAGSASSLIKVSGDSQTAVAGSPLDDSLVVRVTDATGNAVAGVNVTWAVTGGGAVSAAATPTGADGRAAVSRTLGAAAGKQTATASATGLTGSPIVFVATATVGSAGRLVITQQPSSSAASGVAFPRQPTVQIQDANGNPVSTAGIAVAAAMASNPGGGALIGNSTATTDGSGLATFQNLGISGPAGSYTVNFSVPNRSDISGTPPSSTIIISAGAATRLRFAVQPTSISTGGTITPAVTVQVQDAQGTLVSSATTAVTISLGANPGGATLSGTKTVNAVSGIATFSNLSLDRPATGYTLSASASGLAGDNSAAFSVSTGAASQIAANSSTTLAGTAGSPVAPVPSVKVTDGSGNPVAGVNVTFAMTQGGGSVTGAAQTTDASGIATVGSWTLGAVVGTNTLTASASGLAGSPVTFTATSAAGTAGKLAIITQPAATGTSGVALSPQPVLQLVDANNNPVATGGVTITASLASGPGGSLASASVNTNSQGRAIFSGLTISGPSATYTLAFSGTNLTGITSGNIVIGAGAATKLGITTQPGSSVANGALLAPQPVLQLQDGSGNPVGQAGVNVVVSLQSGGGTLGGDLTVQTNSSGQATFTDLRITGTIGTRTLLFAASGLTTVTSTAISVTPGPVSASGSTVTASPASFVAGDPNGSTITVTAVDQSGNVIPGAGVVLSATNGGSFTPPGSTGSNGQVTSIYTTTTAGTHAISAVVSGTTLDDKPTITVSAAPVNGDHSTLTLAPSSIEAGNGSSIVTVTAKDQFDNAVAGASVTLSMSGSDNTISTNPMTTDASGKATFTVSSTTAEDKTVSADIGGTAVTQTQTLTVTAAPVSGANSSLDVGSPGSLVAGQTRQVTVTARNGLNQPMGGATVSLQMAPPTGNSAISDQTTNGSGVATFTVSSTKAENKTISASINGTALNTTGTLAIVAAAPDPAKSAMTLTPTSTTEGGSVTVDLLFHDAFENPVSSSAVTLATDQTGNFTPTSVTTDASGAATTTYSATNAATHTLTATLGGVPISKQLPVSAIVPPPAPDAAQSLVTADSPVLMGAESVVTVTVKDAGGNPVDGATVTLAETGGGGTVSQPAGSTDAEGQITGSFSSLVAGDFTLQATADGVIINQTASISVQ